MADTEEDYQELTRLFTDLLAEGEPMALVQNYGTGLVTIDGTFELERVMATLIQAARTRGIL